MSDDATLDEFTVDSEESNESDMTAESNQTTDDLQTLEASPVEGWELLRLGDVLSFEYGDNLPANTRQDGEIPVYGSNGQVDTHTEANVDRAGIIIGRKGSIGEGEFSSEPFWAIDTTYYVSSKETDENLRFTHYLLQDMELERLNAASAIPGLNRNDAYNLNALIPPLSEQRKIATVLDTIDQAIQKTERIIERIERLHTSLRRDLIISGIEHQEFQEMRIGPFEYKIPVEWEVVSISEACTNLDKDRIPVKQSKREEMEGNIPYYGASGIIDYVDDYLFEDDLILLAEDGENLKARNSPISFKISGKAWVNNHAHVLKPREEFEIDYLVEYFERLNYEPFVTGSAQPKLTQANMEMLSVPKPPKSEQAEIASVLTSISEYRDKAGQNISRLQQLKEGLMQDLLSGELRMSETDIDVPEEVAKYG